MNARKAKHLHRQRQEKAARVLAEARQAEPELLEAHDTFELWRRGRATFLLPVIADDLPDELKQALAAYRTAVLDGSCPLCPVSTEVSRKGLVTTRHDGQCPAHPDRLVELGERLGVEIQRRT
ncbi:hypothetical protein Stsp02_11630 [Streptomyces sp. NBRC 14336]|uniref:hypothetical protein n=1 Tax=Streptomyces sp. NBRC 14336 TaxID=3030992 RepID=UPI0024A55B35|nr:hypothetical protein [Streptomyces sp. NBRC 14336]GLW45501.1 hypothetical protein Stsp02_11630 [Streptomyces sp. NBRC 14336]